MYKKLIVPINNKHNYYYNFIIISKNQKFSLSHSIVIIVFAYNNVMKTIKYKNKH